MRQISTILMCFLLSITVNAQEHIEKQRMQILDLCEAINMAYNIKDSIGLKNYFGGNSLFLEDTCHHTKDSLQRYKSYVIKNSYERFWKELKTAWEEGNNFKCKINEITVTQSPRTSNIYGLSFRQTWKNAHYDNDSYMFFVIEIPDDQEPIIHVCVWTKDINIHEGKKMLPSLSDFDI